MPGSNARRELLADVLALGLVFLMFLAACKLVAKVGVSLPGGPFVWAGVAVFFVVLTVAMCMVAARADREWVDASRRRDCSSLADTDGPHGTPDRGVASAGLGPAFCLSPGRSGRPSRRGPHR